MKKSDSLKLNLSQTTRIIHNKYLYCVLQLSQYVFTNYTYQELENMIRFEVSRKLMNPDNNISKNNVWVYDNNSGELLLSYDSNGYPIQSLYVDIDALVVMIHCSNQWNNTTKEEFSIEALRDLYLEPDKEYTRIINTISMVREYRVRAKAMESLQEVENDFRYVMSTTGRLSNLSIDKLDKYITNEIFGCNINKTFGNYNFNMHRIYEYSDPEVIYLKSAFLRAVTRLVYDTKINGMQNIMKEVRNMAPYVINGNPENYINERVNNIDCINIIDSNLVDPFEYIK